MRVIAILEKSAGNESVGEMWKETASFELNTPIGQILEWAVKTSSPYTKIENLRSNLVITIDQSTKSDEEAK